MSCRFPGALAASSRPYVIMLLILTLRRRRSPFICSPRTPGPVVRTRTCSLTISTTKRRPREVHWWQMWPSGGWPGQATTAACPGWPNGSTVGDRYWRLTGDPEPALRAFRLRLGDRYRHDDTRRLADLGTHASPLVPTLRLLAQSLEPWTALEAAHALIKITGDTDEGRHILIRPVRDLLDGTAHPTVKPAARYLADIDDHLDGHRSTIKTVLSDDRRHSWDDGWAAIHDDLEIRDLLQAALGKSHFR